MSSWIASLLPNHSHGSAIQIKGITFFWIIGAGLLLAILWFRERQRAAAILEMADRLGFVSSGRTLPPSFTMSGTALEGISAAWNVVDGKRRGNRVVAFDCRIGTGKGSWRRTVIAAKSRSPNIFVGLPAILDLATENSGDWTILYHRNSLQIIPIGLMAISELEGLLEFLERGEATVSVSTQSSRSL